MKGEEQTGRDFRKKEKDRKWKMAGWEPTMGYWDCCFAWALTVFIPTMDFSTLVTYVT